jgi:hypothetical protein
MLIQDGSILTNAVPLFSGLTIPSKVHKIENFVGSEFEFCTISLLIMLKYCIKVL